MNKLSGLGRGLSSLIPMRTVEMSQAVTATVTPGFMPPLDQDQASEGKTTMMEVEVDLIRPNPRQPRHDFSHQELDELIESIRIHGILQPLLVSKQEGYYELIAGERRLRAAKILEMRTVPVLVRKTEEEEKLVLALIENIQRQDLNPIEEAMAYQQLLAEFHITQDEVAQRVGKSRPKITNSLRLLRLPKPIQDALINNLLSEGHAKVIAGLESEAAQMTLFHKALQFRLPVRAVEEEAAVLAHRQPRVQRAIEPWMLEKETLLRDALGTKVIIQSKGDRGKIIIEFYGKEDFEEIVDAIVGE